VVSPRASGAAHLESDHERHSRRLAPACVQHRPQGPRQARPMRALTPSAARLCAATPGSIPVSSWCASAPINFRRGSRHAAQSGARTRILGSANDSFPSR
jgi:hypothetical protein